MWNLAGGPPCLVSQRAISFPKLLVQLGVILLRRDVWQHLEMFWVVTVWGWMGHCWHLVGRAQGNTNTEQGTHIAGPQVAQPRGSGIWVNCDRHYLTQEMIKVTVRTCMNDHSQEFLCRRRTDVYRPKKKECLPTFTMKNTQAPNVKSVEVETSCFNPIFLWFSD